MSRDITIDEYLFRTVAVQLVRVQVFLNVNPVDVLFATDARDGHGRRKHLTGDTCVNAAGNRTIIKGEQQKKSGGDGQEEEEEEEETLAAAIVLTE